MKIRRLLDELFKSSASLFYDYPKITISLMLVFSLFLAFQIPNMKLDLSAEGLLHKNDPALHEYNEFRDQFGREGLIIIPIKTQDVFDNHFLNKLRLFHEEIERKTPHVKEVTSLITARNTYGYTDTLFVEKLFENWPENANELNIIKERAVGNELFHDLLFSQDLRYTAVLIETNAYSALDHDVHIIEDFEGIPEAHAQADVQHNLKKKYITDAETHCCPKQSEF